MKEVFLMGNPNVGKTFIIEKLKKDPRIYIPKHVTNRPKREDDTGFYKFVNKEYFKKNTMYFYSKDSNERFYGVDINDIDFKQNKIYLYNASIKNIEDLLKNKRKVFIAVIINKNITVESLIESNKYSLEEAIYRYKEAKKEFEILEKFKKDVNIYFFENNNKIYEIYEKIKKDIEKFYFPNRKIVYNKKIMYYNEKEDILRKYLRFIKVKYTFIKKTIDGKLLVIYRNINLKNLKLNSKEDFYNVYSYILKINKKRKKINRFNNLKFSMYDEVEEYINLLENRIIDTYNKFNIYEFYTNNKFFINEIMLKIKKYFEKLYITHGDLHNENIFVNKSKVIIIDYDEICYANKDMDLLIFVYRYFSKPGYLENKDIEIMLKILKNFSAKYVLELILFYQIKVIFQKIKLIIINDEPDKLYDKLFYWSKDFKVLRHYYDNYINKN